MTQSDASNGGDLPPGNRPNPNQKPALLEEAPEEQAFQERLDRLEARLREARGPDAGQQPESEGRGSAMGAAFKLATEMVAGVAVGGGMGYFGDKFAGTSPFLLITFLILGGAAGIMNAIRVAKDMQKQNVQKQAGQRPESGHNDPWD